MDYLTPISEELVEFTATLPELTLGNSIVKHTEADFPSFDDVQLAIFNVEESRAAVNNEDAAFGGNQIRKELYQLFPGNWNLNIIDLGTIQAGETLEDTYFAVQSLIKELVKNQITPILLGGSQDLTYAMFKGYEGLEQLVNMVVLDPKFDLGNPDNTISSTSYLGKIILKQPNNLFNFSNIGYQTYYNSQEEIDLMYKLYFDAYRVGEIRRDIKLVEPILRDADIFSIDISAIRYNDAVGNANAVPNGFTGEEACAIMRYAGLSSRLSSVGLFEYNPTLDKANQTAKLSAQMVWYFMEGVNLRIKEHPFVQKEQFKKYTVLLEEQDVVFYKSIKSARWWMELVIPDNKYKKTTLLPCSYNDYSLACNGEVPSRWWKAIRKMI